MLSPGSHFAGFFKDASWGTYGIPYVGEAVVENLEIGALWIPCEAAIIKGDGSREYYLAFNEAAAAANGNIVEILSAPVKNYTLKKTTDDPAIYETLKLKRGSYLGSCVNAPGGLPDGYALRSWTYQSDGEEITVRYDFTKPVYSDFTLYAKWTEMTRYAITAGETQNGTVITDKASTYAGDTVTVTATPEAGYMLDTLTAADANGQLLEIDEENFAFTMPASNVTVNATFTRDYLAGHSLSLNGDIGVNFFFDLTEEEASAASVSFAWFDKTSTVGPLALDPNGKGYYIATCRIAPAEMTYAITATLTIGGEEKMTDTYSAKQYADDILSAEYAATYTGTGAKSYANLKALVETMLDYGSRAQVRFNRNPDDLANGGSYIDHTGDPVSITPTANDMAEGLENSGLAYTGTTVVLLTQTSIRHYYTITNQAAFDLIQDSVTFNGASVSYTAKDGEIYFELKNIPASQLDTPYTLHIGDGDYDYAVLDYVRSCLAKTGEQANPKTQALVTAMYYYNKAANAYFAD